MDYQVQSGDTIAKIKSMMDISWSRLRELNPQAVGRSEKNGNWFLKAGEIVTDGRSFASVLEQTRTEKQPEAAAADAAASEKYFEYTVKPGDTLWELAVKRFHVHIEDIIKDNGLKDPDRIQPGQTIRIRRPELQQEQVVTASWYGQNFHGRPMADGDTYDMHANTIAHKELPFGTRVELENVETGERVNATVTDRGPFVKGRDVDLSYGLARKLSLVDQGIGRLKMRILQAESSQI